MPLSYPDWLKTLIVGDKVNAHYDGKSGRGCHGEVVADTTSSLRVRFQAFGHPITKPKVVEVDFDKATGVGYDNSEEGLGMMQMLGVSDQGDYYKLGPIQ